MPQLGTPTVLDRAEVLARYAANRRRTRQLFDLLDESTYYERPISLRNPVVFYEGHVPAFSVNTLIKKALGWQGVDEHLENRLKAEHVDGAGRVLQAGRALVGDDPRDGMTVMNCPPLPIAEYIAV